MATFRRLVLMSFYLFSITLAFASSDHQAVINDFVRALMEHRDPIAAMNRINTYYKQLDSDSQKEFTQEIYSKIIDCQKNERLAETLPLVEAYKLFADVNDSRLPALYYVAGEISALEFGDTLQLKEYISDLIIVNKKKHPEASEYLSKLQQYLYDIRNYVPVFYRMTGGWISMCISDPIGLPYYCLSCEENGTIGLWGSAAQFVGLENNAAQLMEDRKNECASFSFANEKLNVPSAISIDIKNQVATEAGNLVDELITEGLGSSIGGAIGGSLVGAGLRALFESKPSKTVDFIELLIHKPNDYEIEALGHMSAIEKKADEEPKVILDSLYNDLFMLYYGGDAVKNGVFFMDENKKPFTFSKFFYLKSEDNEKSLFKKDGPLHDQYEYYKELVNSHDALFAFNRLQIARYFIWFETLASQSKKSFEKSPLYHSDRNYNTIGVSVTPTSEKEKLSKKLKQIPGLYVERVFDSGTAKLFGIRRGDIIVAVDGKYVFSKEEFKSCLQQFKPLSRITITVYRNGCTIEIPVELGYRIIKNLKNK